MLANQKQKAVLCGILLGLSIQLCSIGGGVQQAQWNDKWGVEPAQIQQLCSGLYGVLIAAMGLRLCLVNALLIVRNMGSSSSQANQTQANLSLDWAVLMGFLLASVVVEILRLILFYDTALVTNAAIKIFLYVSILFFGYCFAVSQEQTKDDDENDDLVVDTDDPEIGQAGDAGDNEITTCHVRLV
ncbi:expressed unknown protein [Seminavis robusta]|uniref:Transmembrane protein n=1 Tax=Seminavis robusta TaxID=568900 RepID=A0A9N8DNG1_9STRA|nr:expressed unknown protein [Seminavis robusta]|eukprot:Sro226_g092070.1 n/a (186) ;mRNA; f:61948-62505